MAKNLNPTREKGQRSQFSDAWLWRFVPQWNTPEWVNADRWRWVVRNQPIAMICRETLIASFLALDWKIEAKDSGQRDELKEEIEYYTDFISDNGKLEYSAHVEWVLQDLLDLPFGGAIEVGREGDQPEGKVLWIELLDGATLFPTLNDDFPIGQRVDGLPLNPVYFPAHAINRLYMTPRPEMKRWGWGMAPPEKIYLALQMLGRGDMYYANLLLDTPGAGILDLGDMEKQSAEAWVESFRQLMGGVNPFKIPVLYEHTNKAEFIPFGKVPNDLMFDSVTTKQAAIVAAGYGMTLSDIGLSGSGNGGDTLAGAIRSERRTRKTGFAVLKKKMTAYFNRLLPPTLRFRLIDYDDELNVALGRARLADATAFGSMIDKKIFSPQEARLQLISDGLVTISVPEKINEKDFDILTPTETPERPGMLGNPVSPSQGGYGESSAGAVSQKSVTKASLEFLLKQKFNVLMGQATDNRLEKIVRSKLPEVVKHLSEVHLSQTELVLKADESDEKWWELDFDEDELVAILAVAYANSVERAAQEIVTDLYQNGYLDSPFMSPNMVFRLTNAFVMNALRSRAKSIIDNINSGSQYYLLRSLAGVLLDGLNDLSSNATNLDIQGILRDNGFVQQLSQNLRREYAQILESRVNTIAGYELSFVENEGRLAQYRRVGLTRKYWEHVGADDPCEDCLDNMQAGVVPLDYIYRGTFGEIKAPPAHPHEHCSVRYVQGDLHNIASQRGIYIWTGD